MGNPLGPTVANIFMCYLEKIYLEQCPLHFKPVFYRRYVDDIFVLFENKEHVDLFNQFLNSWHTNINFTKETEENNSMPFLDVNTFREDNKFHTSVYRKKTFTGLYSHYDSLLPSIYKKGLILTLLYRLYSLCSNWLLFDKEVSFLQKVLSLNGYPSSLVEKCISQFLNKVNSTPKTKDSTEEKPSLTICLPYLGTLSLKMKTQIQKYVKSNIPNCHLRIVFSSKRRLSNFFKFKDCIPKQLNSHLVYKIKCAECNLCYYGLCERHLKVRAFDHLGTSIFTGKPIKGVDTAMKSHCRETNHTITMDDISVLARDQNSFYLRIKESLLIKRDKPLLNNNVYSTPLHLF